MENSVTTQAAFHLGWHLGPSWASVGPGWAQVGPIWEYCLDTCPMPTQCECAIVFHRLTSGFVPSVRVQIRAHAGRWSLQYGLLRYYSPYSTEYCVRFGYPMQKDGINNAKPTLAYPTQTIFLALGPPGLALGPQGLALGPRGLTLAF